MEAFVLVSFPDKDNSLYFTWEAHHLHQGAT